MESCRIIMRTAGCFIDFSLRASIAFLYPFADARIAVSNGAARDLVTLGGLERESIDVVYNPIPLRTPKTNFNVDWGGEGARILAVGSLTEAKNYPLLLNAFAIFAATRPARLIVLGEGPLRPTLEELGRTLGIADRVKMPGEVPDPSPYYASTQVMALTSDHEGFGNVLVEALHQGTTVVSTDCPSGPNEILDGGRFGYLVPCGDVEALTEALGKACDAPFPAQSLVARADLLSGPRIIDQYLSLLLPATSA